MGCSTWVACVSVSNSGNPNTRPICWFGSRATKGSGTQNCSSPTADAKSPVTRHCCSPLAPLAEPHSPPLPPGRSPPCPARHSGPASPRSLQLPASPLAATAAALAPCLGVVGRASPRRWLLASASSFALRLAVAPRLAVVGRALPRAHLAAAAGLPPARLQFGSRRERRKFAYPLLRDAKWVSLLPTLLDAVF